MIVPIKYYDKNNQSITPGMTLQHIDGSTDKVYACGEENEDLGFDANNPDFKLYELPPTFYPLSSFDLSEWSIV